jgi:hypothetical protein
MSEKIKELVNSLKNEDIYTFERRCKEFFYNNSYEFASLDQKNRDFIIDFLKKYRNDVISFGGIPGYKLDNALYQIHGQLSSHGLSELDYNNLKKIANYFRR